jgi:hypothetical protein
MRKKADTKNRTTAEWLELVEKYFDALTTQQEEQELKKFLVTPAADAQCFNEIKAVMGYFATQKAIKKRAKSHVPNIAKWSAVAAAIVAIAATFAWNSRSNEENICIAYVNGIKYTDEAMVMKEMQQTFCMMGNTAEEYSIEEQLNDMFNTINSF